MKVFLTPRHWLLHSLQGINVEFYHRKGEENHRTFYFLFLFPPLGDRKMNMTVFMSWIREMSLYLDSFDQNLQRKSVFNYIFLFYIKMHMTQTQSSHTLKSKKTDLTYPPLPDFLFKVPTEANLKHFHWSLGEQEDTFTVQLGSFCLNYRGQYVPRRAISLFSATGHLRLEHLIVFWLERKSSWLTDRVWSRSMPSLERAEAQGGESPSDWEPQDLSVSMLWLTSGLLYLFFLVCSELSTSWVISAMWDMSLDPKKYIEL